MNLIKIVVVTQLIIWLLTFIASIINIKYVKSLKIDLIILISIFTVNILWGTVIMPYVVTKAVEKGFPPLVDKAWHNTINDFKE